MHAKQFVMSNQETHAPHQLGRDTNIKFQVVLLLAKIQMLRKNVKVSFGTALILHFCGNSVWG